MKTNEDRIFDAYHGRFGTREVQESARERVHWIASSVEGKRVLDMGCSQGLIPLLLGREGHEVLGVDVREEAIDFARSQLDQETTGVRELVRFEVLDAAEVEPAGDGYDSVVMGELLEHQTQPERLLDAAWRVLKPEGKVVITVPFGVHPDPDHKRTFYLTDLIGLVSKRFDIETIFVKDKYICCTATRREGEGGKTLPDSRKLLEETEKAVQRMEKDYRRRLKETRDIAGASKQRYEEVAAKYDSNESILRELVETMASVHTMISASPVAMEVFDPKDAEEPTRLDQLPQIVRQLASALLMALERIAESNRALVAQRDELQGERDELAGELAQVQKRLAGRESILEQVSEEMTAMRSRLEELQKSREKEIELQQQIDHKNWLIHQKDHSIEEKKAQLKEQQKQLKKIAKDKEEEAKKHRAVMREKTTEIRYKLGDAFISSLYQPSRIPGLPLEVAGLFVEGVKKVRAKKRQRFRKKTETLKQVASSTKREPATKPAPPQGKARPSPQPTPASELIHRYETPRLEVPVASILDEFSMENFRYDCRLQPLSKKSWRQELEQHPPRLLLVESAWFGNQGDWQYRITYSQPKPDNPLFELLDVCRNNKIPTVFWNKEDPPNYDRFIDAARRFDYIFTTDANCVERYKKDAPDSRIETLPFAAQPVIHNPVNVHKFEKLGDICFAGAWYPRHPERFEDASMLLEASREYDLHIYDRYLNHPAHEKYVFPDEYQRYIQGSLGYQEMLEKYRQYHVFLNVNSVKDSPTMFSRRVLEILACGTPVVSGYARGIEELLGTDTVPMCRSVGEAKRAIDRLMRDPFYRDRLVLQGQRRIFAEHTYRQRIRRICEVVGIELPEEDDSVSVITATRRKDFVDNLFQNFKRQSHQMKELLVVVNDGDELTPEYLHQRALANDVHNYRVIQVGREVSLGQCLNTAVEQTNGAFFAKMDDDDHYGAHHLQDSLQALAYSGADCVGKESYFTYSEELDQLYLQMPGRQHKMTQFVIGTTLVARKSVYPQVAFGDARVGEDTMFLKALHKAGKTIYSHNQYNYIKFYARAPDHHTWKVDRDDYLNSATFVCEKYNPEACCY